MLNTLETYIPLYNIAIIPNGLNIVDGTVWYQLYVTNKINCNGAHEKMVSNADIFLLRNVQFSSNDFLLSVRIYWKCQILSILGKLGYVI